MNHLKLMGPLTLSLSLVASGHRALAVQDPNLPIGTDASDYPATADSEVPITGSYYIRPGGGNQPNVAVQPFPGSKEFHMYANEEGYPVPSGVREATNAELREEWLQRYMKLHNCSYQEAIKSWKIETHNEDTGSLDAILQALRQSHNARTAYRLGLTNAQKICFNKQIMELRAFAASFMMSQAHIAYLRTGRSLIPRVDIDLMEQPGVKMSAQAIKFGAPGQMILVPATNPKCVISTKAEILAAYIAYMSGTFKNPNSNVPTNQTGGPGDVLGN